MDYGMADWLDELKAIGNGQVPAVAALAWGILSDEQAKIPIPFETIPEPQQLEIDINHNDGR